MLDVQSHRCLQPNRHGEIPMFRDEADDGMKGARAAAIVISAGSVVIGVTVVLMASWVLGF
ncbi:hypothetical protein EBL87_09110 [Cereibacter sphaeroides]|uniref:hypothetical protein n=1 Tax=Cereibacter sphaeroides TaxID=1063 RepID=UPI000F53E396|nr:hypothetical protein [Cereibacter sphaeroides]AZB63887.1 hypothetical protein EBL87_09110 [Cereibacter sphaeroides]AZB68191.1 hypothetical protein EBL86_07360 [Cereibacter sphaeroides]